MYHRFSLDSLRARNFNYLRNQLTTNINTKDAILTLSTYELDSQYFIMYNQKYIKKGFTPRVKIHHAKGSKYEDEGGSLPERN